MAAIENKIFISSFPFISHKIQTIGKKDENVNFYLGFDTHETTESIQRQIVRDILNALLLHEKIVVNGYSILEIANAFDLDDTIELLKVGCFEFLETNGLFFPIIESRSLKSSTPFETCALTTDDTLKWMDIRFPITFKNQKEKINLVINHVEHSLIPINTDTIQKLVLNELTYDLQNSNVTSSLKIISNNRNQIYTTDVLKVLRLLHINSALAYSSIIACDNILLDGAAKSTIEYKLSPISKEGNSDSIGIFEELMEMKAIPDLTDLYLKKIISIHDIIQIRENFNGRKFRLWMKETRYNEDEIIGELMKVSAGINNLTSKLIRFLVSNGIGFINPIAGLIASIGDSFLIDKLLNGWHPNLFLDNTLKKAIDQKIEESEKIQKEKSIAKRFPKVGRNNPCPCGSNKKFKHCCGKI